MQELQKDSVLGTSDRLEREFKSSMKVLGAFIELNNRVCKDIDVQIKRLKADIFTKMAMKWNARVIKKALKRSNEDMSNLIREFSNLFDTAGANACDTGYFIDQCSSIKGFIQPLIVETTLLYREFYTKLKQLTITQGVR